MHVLTRTALPERGVMTAEIQVVSRGARWTNGDEASHRLLFPAHWHANPIGNTAELAIERGTLEWLAKYGMGISPAEREKLRKFECGKYGGYSLPRAPLPEALLITQFISLWLFWDDVEVEDNTSWSIDDVAAAFTAGPSPSANSYVMAWNDNGKWKWAQWMPFALLAERLFPQYVHDAERLLLAMGVAVKLAL